MFEPFLPPKSISWILIDILQLVVVLIIVDVVRSWLNMMGTRNTSPRTPWVRTLHLVIGPILAPFRALWEAIVRAISPSYRSPAYALQRLDLSPLLAIVAINIVQNILFRVQF